MIWRFLQCKLSARLWPTVLRLGETSAKHLLRLERVPVLIPLGGHYTEAVTGR